MLAWAIKEAYHLYKQYTLITNGTSKNLNNILYKTEQVNDCVYAT